MEISSRWSSRLLIVLVSVLLELSEATITLLIEAFPELEDRIILVDYKFALEFFGVFAMPAKVTDLNFKEEEIILVLLTRMGAKATPPVLV